MFGFNFSFFTFFIDNYLLGIRDKLSNGTISGIFKLLFYENDNGFKKYETPSLLKPGGFRNHGPSAYFLMMKIDI